MNSESSSRGIPVAEREPTAVESSDGEREQPAVESGDADPAVDEAIARIRQNATAVRDRQVETALARLDSQEDVSEAERAAVERLADRLVARLISVPERALREGEAVDGETVDDETVETAVELFG